MIMLWIAVLFALGGCASLSSNTKVEAQVPQPIKETSIPAFPGAEGFGATSVGGRGGRIIEVTNLYDTGPGSFRAAVEAKGRRTVIFRVAGTIELFKKIQIKNPYLTIAGQTAPGGGITLKGRNSSLLGIQPGAHDIIIRYLRLRNGSGTPNGSGNDNLTINGGHNIVIDHVSMSWSTDENASIFRREKTPPITNISIQRSILSEGIAGHSNGLIVTGKPYHSWFGQRVDDWKETYSLSIHQNLFAHNTHRNPRVTSGGTQVINNVMYNWKFRIGETTRGSIIDVVNNYAKLGPMSERDHLFLHEVEVSDWFTQKHEVIPSIYTVGNLVDPIFTNPNADNWDLWQINGSFNRLPQEFRRQKPLLNPPFPVRERSARAAYDSVVADVGANARVDCLGNWVRNADAIDQRIINDVKNRTGPTAPIASPESVGGYLTIEPGQACADRDRDGMPDGWEARHRFDPNNPADRSNDADQDGYTNLEEYLNGTL